MSAKHWFFAGICLFLLLASLGPLYGQGDKTRILKDEIPRIQPVAFSYFDQFGALRNSNPDSMHKLLDKSYRYFREIDDNLHMAKALDYKGLLEHDAKNYDEAIDLFMRAYREAAYLGNNERLGSITLHLGSIYGDMGELDSALHYTLESVNIRRDINKLEKIGSPMNNIGNYMERLGRYEDAISYFEKSAINHLKYGKKYKYLDTQGNLAALLLSQGRYEEVLQLTEEAMAVNCENCEDLYAVLKQKRGIAMYWMKGDPELAESLLRESLIVLQTESRYVEHQCATLRTLALLAKDRGDTDIYIDLLDQSLALALENDQLMQLQSNYLEFGRYHEEIEDFKNALHFFQLYNMISDSVLGPYAVGSADKVIMEDLRKRSQRLIQEQQAAIQSKNRENQLMRIIGGLFVALILGGWRAYFLINRKNKTIEDQNDELQKFNDTLKLDVVQRTSELEETSKVLDNFIYRTSHDIRGPIASLKGLSNVAQLEVDDPVAREYFDRIRNTADNMEYVLDGLREVNKVKYAEILTEEFDVRELVIRSVNHRRKGRKHISVTLSKPEKIMLSSDQEIAFAAVDKIIDNAFKFHRPQSIKPEVFIDTYKYNGGVKVKISDNGIGIDEEQIEYIFGLFGRASDQSQFGGIGLYVAKLAINRLGGAIRAERNFKKGLTCFEIYLPHLKTEDK